MPDLRVSYLTDLTVHSHPGTTMLQDEDNTLCHVISDMLSRRACFRRGFDRAEDIIHIFHSAICFSDLA